MRVAEARRSAVDWVRRNAAARDDFRGAYFSGSVTELSEDTILPGSSDVDVVIVVRGAEQQAKLGKLQHGGVLLEVTQLPEAEFLDVHAVAGSFFLAPSFRTDQIIADPSGLLHRVLQRVQPRFGEPEEIRRRYRSVLVRMQAWLDSVGDGRPWPQQVLSWLFAASMPTLIVLVAAQQNPTVRLRYLRARTVLVEHGRADLYAQLLALIGCSGATPAEVQHNLDRLAATFDRTIAVARTPFFFSSDISALARPIAIAGSQELIDAGDHAEAVFWVIATFARCHQILEVDAPALAEQLAPDFAAALSDLVQVRTRADLGLRAAEARALLPAVLEAAESIIERGQTGRS